MKRTKFFRFLCFLLALVTIVTSVSPLEAYARKKSIMETETHTLLTETTFVVTKQANVKSVPYRDHGRKLGELYPGDVIVADSYSVNIHNNAWIEFTYNENKAFYFSDNLEIHSEHSYNSLQPQGFNFNFCTVCGHVKSLDEIYEIPFTETNPENYKIHIALTVLSLMPVVGTAADCTEALLYLSEGNTNAALLAFAGVIPVLGDMGILLKSSDEIILTLKASGLITYADDAIDASDDVISVIMKLDGEKIYTKSTPSSTMLGRNMKEAYDATRNKRFFKNPDDGKYAWAAHHIVAGDDPGAKIAQQILNKYGININSSVNGVYLPMKRGISEGTLHNGRHSMEYYEYVNTALSRTTSREEAIEILNDIAVMLSTGKLTL